MTSYRIIDSHRHDPARVYYTRASASPVRTLAQLLGEKHRVPGDKIVIVAEVAA